MSLNHILKMYFAISVTFMTFAFAGNEVEREWTFLIFLNANNNLDSFGDMNLKQMESLGSNERMNIVVQWGSMSRKTVKRMLVKKSTNPNKITSPVVQDLGNADMGDFKELEKFLKWGHQKYPAKKYFVSVWNHGNGWYRSELAEKGIHINDISYDDKTGNKITTEQLGLVMGNFSKYIHRKIDLYGSDACLMSMAEVASEMKDSVSYFAGSQQVEPGEGWPYKEFLRAWNKAPESGPAQVGNLLADEYLKAYSGGVYGHANITFSILNLNALSSFENSVKSFVSELRGFSQSEKREAMLAANEALYFTNSDYKDFFHFIKLLDAKNLMLESTKAKLNTTFNDLVVVSKNSESYKEAKGLSIWLPDSAWQLDRYKERYSKLKFNQNTSWLEFLDFLNQN